MSKKEMLKTCRYWIIDSALEIAFFFLVPCMLVWMKLVSVSITIGGMVFLFAYVLVIFLNSFGNTMWRGVYALADIRGKKPIKRPLTILDIEVSRFTYKEARRVDLPYYIVRCIDQDKRLISLVTREKPCLAEDSQCWITYLPRAKIALKISATK